MRSRQKTSKEQATHELLPTSRGGKARIEDKMSAAEKTDTVYYNLLYHIVYVYIIMIFPFFITLNPQTPKYKGVNVICCASF